MLIRLILASFLVGAYVLNGDSDDQLVSMLKENLNGGRLVNENQMIQLLTTQKFNTDIIIIREIIRTDQRPIYQNICLAKQAGKN